MILITGATGFLGRFLVEELHQAGYKLRLLVRNAANRKLVLPEGVEVVDGEILDIMSLSRAMEGVEKVIHAAAIVSFWKKRKEEMMKINVEGTANVVDACLEMGVKQLLHISSIAAIGRESGKYSTETTPWIDQGKYTSNYSRSKYKAELEVYRGIAEGLSAFMINPSVILGPSQNWRLNTAKIFSIVDDGIRFYNKGITGFVGVQDVAKAARILLASEISAGERFLLSESNLTQLDLMTQIAHAIDKKPPKYQLPAWLTLMVGPVSEFLAWLSRKEPVISRETMRTSVSKNLFDGSKIVNAGIGFEYTPIEKVIKETGKVFLEEKDGK